MENKEKETKENSSFGKAFLSKKMFLAAAIAAVLLVAAVGSASAQPGCVDNTNPNIVYRCGDTVVTSCTFNGSMTCPTEPTEEPGLTVGDDGIVIDGAGFTITGSVTVDDCAWATETSPSHECGILIDGSTQNNADVVIKNLEIERFCTGIALHGAGNPIHRIDNVTIDNCKIHDNGFDNGDSVTQGVHACWIAEGAEGAPALTITNNEIYNNEGTGAGCGGGGNGIFIYGGSPSSTHEYCNISYNYLHHNAKAGFWTKMMLSKCDITHNKVTENGGGAGITDDVQGGIIFRCKHTSYNLVAYNNASNNGGGTDYGYGIYVGGYNNIIRDNDDGNETFGGRGDTCGVNDNTADGICMCRSDGADNNQILHNTICSNHRYGVHATSNTFNNSLYYNYICYNWQTDVYDESNPNSYIELHGDYNHGATAYQYCDAHAVDCPDIPFWGECDLIGPDLTVSDKYETWVNTDVYTITFTVTNAGNMQAGASNTRVWVNDNVQGTYPCSELNPGETNTTTTAAINLASPPNPDTVLVCADVDGIVTETNEYNNCTENKFGAADLEIILPIENYVVWTDYSWKTYELHYQVKNVGDRATPNDVWVNFTELWGEWKDCVNPVPIPAGLQPGQTTAMLTAGPFVMGDAADWVEEWVNFNYSCPVNYWNVLHHDRTRWTEGYPTPEFGGVCWDDNGVVTKCGDVDGDGLADTNDMQPLFDGVTPCEWAADVNCDALADTNDMQPLFDGNYNCCAGCSRPDW